MSQLQIGSAAPELSLKVANDQPLFLSDLNGEYVVLYFYPKDDTPGCTIEAKGFNELKGEFDRLGARIIGVSKDNLTKHDKFAEKYDLKFELGSDAEGSTCEDYGVWAQKSMFGKKYMGINRVTYLIDKEGKIAHIWQKVSPKFHPQEVLDKLIFIS